MSDFCLCFPDEPTAFAAAQALDAVVMTEDGPRLVRFTHRYALDVIGEITLPATLDEAGAEIAPATTLPGWHVNFRILDGSEIPEILQPYIVQPANPSRVWA